MAEGWQTVHATMADWVLHLSTLFPDVRLKRYLEVRSADSVPLDFAPAFAAIWKGLLYDDDATRAAAALTDGWAYEDRLRIRAEVPRGGFKVQAGKHTLGQLAVELLAIARRGLPAEERAALDPLDELVAEQRSLAERLLARFGDHPPLPAELAH
jgi:glutamate--cysteine ligase